MPYNLTVKIHLASDLLHTLFHTEKLTVTIMINKVWVENTVGNNVLSQNTLNVKT